jgi:hypothetical protein
MINPSWYIGMNIVIRQQSSAVHIFYELKWMLKIKTIHTITYYFRFLFNDFPAVCIMWWLVWSNYCDFHFFLYLFSSNYDEYQLYLILLLYILYYNHYT